MRTARTSLGTLVTTAALALGAIGLAVAAPGGVGGTRHDEVRIQAAGGAVTIASSREGLTLFSASGMRPGQSAGGTVRLTHTSEDARALTLSAAVAQDAPGAGGGRLTDQLVLEVSDTTPGHAAHTLWTGAPAALASVPLGSLPSGEQRTYAVTATLPPGAGNAYQGASTSLDLRWTLSGGSAPVTPVPTTGPVATGPVTLPVGAGAGPGAPGTTPPATPTPPGTGVPAGTPVDVAGEQLGLPATRACASRRHFKIKLHAPAGATMRSAVVRVNNKVRGRVKGKKAAVDLRGLPKGRAVVAIVVRATDGRAFRSTRTYRTCNAA
jgi:hypothetical protein